VHELHNYYVILLVQMQCSNNTSTIYQQSSIGNISEQNFHIELTRQV